MPDPKADLRDLLAALVKIALVGLQGETDGWRTDAIAAQRRVQAEAGAAAALPLDDLWSAAVIRAERDPAVRRDETVNPTLPMRSPVGIERLGAVPFDLESAVQAIRDAASFG